MSSPEPSSLARGVMRWLPWLVGIALLASVLAWLLPGLERSNAVGGIERETASMLQALGYAEWTEGQEVDVDVSGVVRADPERSAPGYNVFTSRSRAPAVLMDHEGTILHEWDEPAWERGKWQHVELQPDGSLFLVLKHAALVKFDWDSNVLWKTPMKIHHDIDVGPDGRIYALGEGVEEFPYQGRKIPINDNQIVTISPEGEILNEISLYPLLADFVDPERFEEIDKAVHEGEDPTETRRNRLDALHTNSVEVLREDLGDIAPAGSFLLSVRNIDLVVIIDSEGKEVLWSWGPGEIIRQHHATVLPNGNILLFDNRDGEETTLLVSDNPDEEKASRVVEVDPATKKIVWEYRGTEADPFYSYSRGSSQKLENGNVLIAESNRGRALEVTPNGEIVWEYLNPQVSLTKMKRGTFYRMTRVPPGFLEPEHEAQLRR